MRRFRTSTDSVFDIPDLDEGTREITMVSQAGPPAQETAVAQDPAGP